jgi:transcriptional regulator with XRE-family HTH domain
MHPISKFLEGQGLTQADFAKQVGLSRQQINNVVRGRSNPSLRTIRKIVEVTGGEITLLDLVAAMERSR